MGDKGPFVNISGSIVIKGAGYFDSGIIANASSGVVRIQGTTDLRNCKYVSSSTSGGLIKNRGTSLVYALGDGKGSNGNWSFIRPKKKIWMPQPAV